MLMKILIAEDEKPAAERLETLLLRYDPAIQIAGVTDSVEETVRFLRTNPNPDLILLDIHLSDGPGFAIFDNIKYNIPVILTTAYDNYALQSFRLHSIDYILKPVTLHALSGAINKMKEMAASFSARQIQDTGTLVPSPFKKRFVGKVGARLFFIDTADIAFFSADNKIVYITTKAGKKFTIDYTLETLENMLDPKLFFRVSRSYIVQASAIEQIRPYYNNRLRLFITGAATTDEMIISRERVSDFKKWAEL